MEKKDSVYINRLRGASILRVVLGHLGLGWILLPYSSFIGIFLPVLFFCSGFIFFYIFKKSSSIKSYLFRRLSGVLVPFYLVYLIALFISFAMGGGFHHIDLEYVVRIILVSPEVEHMPYPLGQIWYLRVLIFCSIVSPIIFTLAKRDKYYLLIPVCIATLLALIQTEYSFHQHFFYLGHNLIQEIVYGGYFFIGAFVYCTDWRNKKRLMAFMSLLSVAIAIWVLKSTGSDIKLGSHSYIPDMYYFPLGIVGILMALLLAETFEKFLNIYQTFGRFLDFCSQHSYGIYLNHSFFIIFYEVVFGLKGVINDPILALVKIILVVASSLVFAVPVTYASKYFLRVSRKKESGELPKSA